MTKTMCARARVRRRVTIGLAVLIGATALGWLVSSAAATAAGTGAALPPIATFPEAGDTAPPPAVIDPAYANDECTDWYRQSAYFGGQATGSTWWEYSCRMAWPIIGEGATNADWGVKTPPRPTSIGRARRRRATGPRRLTGFPPRGGSPRRTAITRGISRPAAGTDPLT